MAVLGNILAMDVPGQTALDAARARFNHAVDLGNAGGMFEYVKLLADTDAVSAYS